MTDNVEAGVDFFLDVDDAQQNDEFVVDDFWERDTDGEEEVCSFS